MQDNDTTKGKQGTIDNRRLIESWKKEGKSNREMASLLGKVPQTSHKEIKRATVLQCLGQGRLQKDWQIFNKIATFFPILPGYFLSLCYNR